MGWLLIQPFLQSYASVATTGLMWFIGATIGLWFYAVYYFVDVNLLCCDCFTLRDKYYSLLHIDEIKLQRLKKQQKPTNELASEAKARYEQRLASKPEAIHYPDLPIAMHRADIAEALKTHQIIVLSGDTGSGKTTQLPKICIEAGLADRGQIVVTQPRRIAARSVANRIGEELSDSSNQWVGYQTRFEKQIAEDGLIKVVTDGILLSEIQRDRFLNQYSVVIIDEAHERSLNIDFLLGYLKTLLAKRADLKLIVTSATISVEQLVGFFPKAKSFEIPGRQYPVDIVYQPLVSPQAADDDPTASTDARDQSQTTDESEISLPEGIAQGCEWLWQQSRGEGDVLVFLPGEREIHEAAKHLKNRNWRRTDIVLLYGRLSAADQQKIFHPDGNRRVVLSTNVAETSLTVPRIRYVIDSGLARIAHYSPQSKLQRLPIVPISQASANQRAGRCGRLMPGICVRLYEEADFLSRDEYTAPEILRVNLASVLLQMLQLRLGDIRDFPFISVPANQAINDGYKTLEMLGAISQQRKMSRIGQQMARLPIEPKFARVLIEANKQGVLYPCIVIMAALSVQDIRENPKNAKTQAQQAHALYKDERSDFLFYWHCWVDLMTQKAELSNNQFRQYCQKKYLRYLRIREWLEVVGQLTRLSKQNKWQVTQSLDEVAYEPLHQSLLAGFLSQIASKHEDNWYIGPRGQKLRIFPGSPMVKRKPNWIMAGLWLETRAVYAHEVAKIQPEWLLSIAPELIKTHYDAPYWQKKTSRVVAKVRKSFFGLTIAHDQVVNYAPIDPDVAREIFIQSALVSGEFFTKADFLTHNQTQIEEIKRLEAEQRRVDLLLTDIELAALYDQVLPADVVDGNSFNRWYHSVDAPERQKLSFDQQTLMQPEALETAQDLPKTLQTPVFDVPLSYHFEPGNDKDGITAHIPIAVLNQLSPMIFSWIIPAWRVEKIAALIKSMPKAKRKLFVPAPDFAKAAAQRLADVNKHDISLINALAKVFSHISGQSIDPMLFDELAIDKQYQMRFEILADTGKVLASGRDLTTLQQRMAENASQAFHQALGISGEQSSSTQHKRSSGGQADKKPSNKRESKQQQAKPAQLPAWGQQPLPERVEQQHAGVSIAVFVGLKYSKRGLVTAPFESLLQANQSIRQALVALIQQRLADKFRYVRQKLPQLQTLKLLLIGLTDEKALIDDFLYRLTSDVFGLEISETENQLPRTQPAVDQIIQKHQAQVIQQATKSADIIVAAMQAWRDCVQTLNGLSESQQSAWSASLKDIQSQMDKMVYPHFIRQVPSSELKSYERYFKAIGHRLEKLKAGATARDADMMKSMAGIQQEIEQRIAHHQQHVGILPTKLWRARELLQELRVSLFAQQLGAKERISLKRIQSFWQAAELDTRIPGVTD